ncbi:MAG TPA: serine hydrolase domain-containing protein [Phycisphaerales bacterium]|nr:serine hydrolase domain-containing protein [Phycisphaerales bacterium]
MIQFRRAAAVAAIAIAGCAFAQPAAPDPVFEPAAPESQGIPAAALAALGETVAGFLEKDYALGAELLVIKNRKIVFHEAYGVADREEGKPWATGTGAGTVCNIRSMTKTLTGAAAQILIDRGKLGLDDPASKYLPGFDNEKSRGITLRHLLTHRSGLPLTMITTALDQYPDLLALANAAGEHGPDFEPGTKFWYSDAGTDCVAAIVEVIAGETIDQFVTREIIGPLQMTDSFYALDASDPRFARIASLYLGQPGSWARFWSAGGEPLYPFAWGSQTIYSTPLDYAKFLGMWMDGGLAAGGTRVLSEEAVARTLTPASPMSMLGSDARFPTDFRGLDTYYGQMSVLYCPEPEAHDPEADEPDALPTEAVIISHSGSDGTIAWAWPELDLMVLYFTQSRGGTSPLRIEEAIDRLLIHPGEAAVAEIPEHLKPLIGVYLANFANYDNERFEVLIKGGKLALDIPSQMVFELLDPDAEGMRAFALAPDKVKVSFHLGDDGNADVLQIHQGGETFEVPREGSALAAEQARKIEIPAEVLRSVVGKYKVGETGAVVEVFLDADGVLSIKDSPTSVFQLRPSRDAELTWVVRQNPAVSLSFEKGEDGAIVSMTRHVGGATLVMPRQEE